jgi:DNA-binding response OmpR family regulator
VAKILLVEDDKELSATVAKYLTMERHIVEVANDGQDGLDRVLSGFYDVIILDVNLPKVDGIEICRRYRSHRGKTPVIMLTGKVAVAEKELGLDSGADDYITKPFSTRELSARVRALLRRPGDLRDNRIDLGNLSLDLSAHSITKDGTPLRLNPIDYSLLQFLIRHNGEFFSAEALIAQVWHTDTSPGPDAVRSAIRRIRQQIDTEGEESLIETVSKVGYRIRQSGESR